MKYLLLFFGVLIPSFLTAQEENTYWAFGHQMGLDFNQNPPAVFQTELICWEGGSVFFSDASGNKLFYSNGNEVWDANNNVMPNGSGITGNGPASPGFPCSSAQGTVSAQSVTNPNQYYLFTLDAVEDVPPFGLGKLRYSIIDMSLNSGLGDVVASEKNIVLEDSLSEKMMLVPGDGCNYWLLVHHVSKPLYYAFKIDAGGIAATPVISTGLLPGLMGIGMMSISPDGSKVVLSHSLSGLEIGAFDKATGVISNVGQFSSMGQFGMSSHCFSPDNTKLYLSRNSRLLQYDVSFFPNVSALEASAIEIATGNNAPWGYMRRGPDDKIYIADYNSPSLAVINNPNNPGLACNYNPNGISLPAFAQFANPASPNNPYYGLGLGQTVLSVRSHVGTGTSSLKDTLVCPGAQLTFSITQGRDHYLWNNEETDNTITVKNPGTYWVHSWQGCRMYADTFIVRMVTLDHWGIGNDTTLCPGVSLLLNAYAPAIDHYLWSDGSTSPTYTAGGAGSYVVTADIKGCTFSDTLTIAVFAPYVEIQQQDTTLCKGNTLLLRAEGWPECSYRWQDGTTDSVLEIHASGSYIVAATNICGTYSDSVRIAVVQCDCRSFVPNAFTPNGDGRNDVFELHLNCPNLEAFQFYVFNRYGERIFQTDNPDRKWDGFYKGKPLDTGTYFYYLRYKGPQREAIEQKGDILLIR